MSINNQGTRVYLITGNTRIGGAQRIALDEFYELSNREIQVKLVSLNPIIEDDDILNVDKKFPPVKDVTILAPGSGKLEQFKYFFREFRENPNKTHVVSHDFSGVLISRCAALASGKKITIDLYIHQLMELSD